MDASHLMFSPLFATFWDKKKEKHKKYEKMGPGQAGI